MVRVNKLSYWDSNINQVEAAILRCFFPEGEEISMNKIKERSGYSYERIHTTLKRLEEKKIVKSEKKGKSLLYFKADYNNLYLKLAFHHYMTERLINFGNKRPIIYNSLKKLGEEPLGMVLLFGSYSKGNETKNSDIDLMIVSEYQKERENAIYGLKSRYGLKISSVFVKRIEFPKIKKENPELWNDLKNYALIFKGTDLFYYWIYQYENN